jgi:hypothetical protein
VPTIQGFQARSIYLRQAPIYGVGVDDQYIPPMYIAEVIIERKCIASSACEADCTWVEFLI